MRQVLAVLIGLVLLFWARDAFAQELPTLGGVAVNVEVADDQAAEGDIISIVEGKLQRSSEEYDIKMYGVIVASPVLSVAPKSDTTKSVITSGSAQVKVSAQTEAIKTGDFITTSQNPGVGQKATASGFIVGKALADYENSQEAGIIPVEVNIGFFEVAPNTRGLLNSILTNLNNAFKAPKSLQSLLRYILAFIVGTMTFIAATFSFIKFTSTGIEALGRNPMAKRTIIVSMLLSGAIVVVLALAGLGIAAAIIGFGRN
ncbi:hypothetical protein A3F02_03195 [Candidatus Curtissbacteria bacterium RIFCSPHIGHO2_12_FULL_38_9b]|uniref:Uncharacterized protein n=1 Tax=Candidatus Curtissbacteria bacterium RIFCSPHIGHO2_12_FULL_38_9b TaxID=1797720 RepID=A0A1F5GW13_9BACT|nr:MAG: hypothetical protein A3F02_03195 [Candidatus Curtissbacteria bacterium RIFCSPHIGHO2_12_FULL_38_9b]